MAADADTLLLVGRIHQPHGVQGDVKVAPETDDPARFAELDVVYLGADPATAQPRAVRSVRFQPRRGGTTVVLGLEDVDGREAAETLRGSYVYAREADLPPLEEEEYFLHDLPGLRVEREDGTAVGKVKDVLSLPAQDVLVVEQSDGGEAMIPIVDAFVTEINVEAGRIRIRPIEGLLA